MKTSWLIGTATLLMLAGSAWAVEDAAPAPHGMGMEHGEGGTGGRDFVPYKDLTLEQARKHAHEHADKLDKMTPAEWEAHKKQVMERREKWKSMSPEERSKMREKFRSMREQRMGGAAAPQGQAPAGN